MLLPIDAINSPIYKKTVDILVVLFPELGYIGLNWVKYCYTYYEKNPLSFFIYQALFHLPVIVSCSLYKIYWMFFTTSKCGPIIYVSL